jgi:glycine betaine/proline transport system permease protein
LIHDRSQRSRRRGLEGIQRLQPDKGFEAGIAIVIIAMILDRVMQGVGRKSRGMVHAE